MKATRELCFCASLLVGLWVSAGLAQPGALLIFAVVTKISDDKREVGAQVFVSGAVSEAALLADETILRNMMWGKLEICQCLRAQALKTDEGYRIVSFRMLAPSMLPMPLQGVAGDCLTRKALEYAPLLD